jgi:hypothetical protein
MKRMGILFSGLLSIMLAVASHPAPMTPEGRVARSSIGQQDGVVGYHPLE